MTDKGREELDRKWDELDARYGRVIATGNAAIATLIAIPCVVVVVMIAYRLHEWSSGQ